MLIKHAQKAALLRIFLLMAFCDHAAEVAAFAVANLTGSLKQIAAARTNKG